MKTVAGAGWQWIHSLFLFVRWWNVRAGCAAEQKTGRFGDGAWIRWRRSAGGLVYTLAVWEGQLISGHGSGMVRVWDVRTEERQCELAGHTALVCSLFVVGSLLASGSFESIQVWANVPEWLCERTLTVQKSWVSPLAGWAGRLISGSGDRTIRMCELETGGLDATLTGHGGAVWRCWCTGSGC